MDFTFQQYEESAQAIRARLGGFAPKVAMILGSGLGYQGFQIRGRGWLEWYFCWGVRGWVVFFFHYYLLYIVVLPAMLH